jgi:hypothetical protein
MCMSGILPTEVYVGRTREGGRAEVWHIKAASTLRATGIGHGSGHTNPKSPVTPDMHIGHVLMGRRPVVALHKIIV